MNDEELERLSRATESLPQIKFIGKSWTGITWIRFADGYSLRADERKGELTLWRHTHLQNNPELAKALYAIWKLTS